MDDDDDFTFPAPAPAAAAEGRQDCLGLLSPLRPGGHLTSACASSSSTLWPFSSSSPCSAAPPCVRATAEAEEAPASTGSGCGDEAAVARRPPLDVGLHERTVAAADEERMDLLWEDFNDELLLQLRRERAAGGTTSSADDGRSDEEAPSPGRPHGCAPTMLRASSRAGGVGQFYGRRGRCRSRPTGWELLLRLFRKLFAVDKSPSQHRPHGSIIYSTTCHD